MRRTATSLALLLLLPLTACADDDPAEPSAAGTQSSGSSASADLLDPGGESVGTASLTFGDGTTQVDVRIDDLPPGLHAFHLHKTGRCEPDSPDPADAAKVGDFLSAGGHLAAEGQQHGDHDGDLPSLLVTEDGTASLSFVTDRVTADDVLDEDGTAVMVHADPDNFSNIPERYAPAGPDETTTKTGDAGGRVACAALTAQG